MALKWFEFHVVFVSFFATSTSLHSAKSKSCINGNANNGLPEKKMIPWQNEQLIKDIRWLMCLFTWSQLSLNIRCTAFLHLLYYRSPSSCRQQLPPHHLQAQDSRGWRRAHTLSHRLLQDHVTCHPCAVFRHLPWQWMLKEYERVVKTEFKNIHCQRFTHNKLLLISMTKS